MKLRSVEQLSKDERYLFLDDARTVVLHADLVPIGAGGLQMNPDLRHDSGFLARIQGIVDGFLYGGEERLSRVIETEKVPVLREELADGNVPLLRRHCLGSCPAGRSFGSSGL